MDRCCAVGVVEGKLDLINKTLNGHPATVSSTLLKNLHKNDIEGDRWLVYPRYRAGQWGFYVLSYTNKEPSLVIKGVIKWVRVRNDGKLDIGIKIKQKHHNHFTVILISTNDKYYRRGRLFNFNCNFDFQSSEIIADNSYEIR